MSRHHVLVGSCIALLAAGCTGGPPTITPAPPTTESAAVPTPDPNAEALTVQLATTAKAVGLGRVPFEVADAQGVPIPVQSTVEVGINRVEDVAEGQTMSLRAAGGNAVRFGDDLPEGGAWVVYHEFDASGPWSLEVTVTFPDGRTGTGKARFDVVGRSQTPRVGERPTVGDTPTVAEGGDPTAVTGDPDPDPALYAVSAADAVANGKPTVLVIAAPATCPPCATTLRETRALMNLYADRVNFVHVESSDSSDPASPSEFAAAWGIGPDVPWTFVFDAQGYVQARVEGPLGRTELELLVKRASGQG